MYRGKRGESPGEGWAGAGNSDQHPERGSINAEGYKLACVHSKKGAGVMLMNYVSSVTKMFKKDHLLGIHIKFYPLNFGKSVIL